MTRISIVISSVRSTGHYGWEAPTFFHVRKRTHFVRHLPLVSQFFKRKIAMNSQNDRNCYHSTHFLYSICIRLFRKKTQGCALCLSIFLCKERSYDFLGADYDRTGNNQYPTKQVVNYQTVIRLRVRWARKGVVLSASIVQIKVKWKMAWFRMFAILSLSFRDLEGNFQKSLRLQITRQGFPKNLE